MLVQGAKGNISTSQPLVTKETNGRSLVARGASCKRKTSRAPACAQLDGFLLLDASGAEYPDEANMVKLVQKGLKEVIREDLVYYTHLSIADFGENELNIADVSASFTIMEEVKGDIIWRWQY